MKEVKDKIMYQATNLDYKVGEKIFFGKDMNYQGVKALQKNFFMLEVPIKIKMYVFV